MVAIPRTTLLALIALFAAVLSLQALLVRQPLPGLPAGVSGNLLYVRSPEFMKRASLSYDALVADAYWIRAVQHYGRTKLATQVTNQYDLLYPLLDLTTSLDPYFDIAYRFGAIFLAENYPAGAGRPDQAIALLQKGLKAQPKKWELAQDIGFVYYWWVRDYAKAAEWFTRAGDMPGGANWLKPLAAVTLAQGGSLASSRQLWTEVMNTAEADWLRAQGRLRLAQLDAMDEITLLERVSADYRTRNGMWPPSWAAVVRAGYLRGIPVDPTGQPLQLDPSSGRVTLSRDSTLNPLPYDNLRGR